ncbi:hypothetical protein [Marinigracilibium pacificum]|uniref:Uncharacterized protein n=1 Tax=Marinigracilibium pacificum TaxID=2729599 RepID=A0A848IYV8_9BACT|nr:hypothetical protein [Marinigracilibium pacificum]NMM49713.1 hypothetical protein [Marinigracilibium pacificum]
MHDLIPYEKWLKYYRSEDDDRSPFYGKEYNFELYTDNIYGYYIDPAWDFIGSDTLYLKILYVDYERSSCIIEFIGEWNDAITNDSMHLKRNVIDPMINEGINKFLLIGENVFNFHGDDDSYYEEWYEDVEDGWICAVGFHKHVYQEWKIYGVDSYIDFGGSLELINWRTFKPMMLIDRISMEFSKRLGL